MDELVRVLRETDFSDGCPCEAEPMCQNEDCVIAQAADAIEELQKCVPPVPHGRLIDADALEALFWDGQCYFTENIKYKIKNIETICPAEEGE